MTIPIVSLERRKTVATLNDLTDEQVEEARGWALKRKAEAAWFLESLVVKCHLGWAASFIDEVLLGSADAKTWGFADVLCIPDVQWDALVASPLDASFGALASLEGERHVRCPPLIKDHISEFCGAPGVFVRGKPYWWDCPEGVEGLLKAKNLEPVENLAIAGRRWIASRVAWKWKFTRTSLPRTPLEVASALKLQTPLSRDGEIAIAGLIREQTITAHHELAPGFRGPDAWYSE